MHDGMPYGRMQGQGQGHEPIQGSRIENLQSREVDRQSPTGLIFIIIITIIIIIIIIIGPIVNTLVKTLSNGMIFFSILLQDFSVRCVCVCVQGLLCNGRVPQSVRAAVVTR